MSILEVFQIVSAESEARHLLEGITQFIHRNRRITPQGSRTLEGVDDVERGTDIRVIGPAIRISTSMARVRL
jgi:hypothetical protein